MNQGEQFTKRIQSAFKAVNDEEKFNKQHSLNKTSVFFQFLTFLIALPALLLSLYPVLTTQVDYAESDHLESANIEIAKLRNELQQIKQIQLSLIHLKKSKDNDGN